MLSKKAKAALPKHGKYLALTTVNPDGSLSVSVLPWELQVGDRILGTQLVISGRPSYRYGDIGSDAFRQKYIYPVDRLGQLRFGQEPTTDICYTADCPAVSVIRKNNK